MSHFLSLGAQRARATLLAALATIALALGVGVASPVDANAVESSPGPVTTAAAAKKFKNCKALNKKYAGGVAKNKKAKNTKVVKGKKVPAASKYRPKVSKKLYDRNKHLDRDKDGIACER